MAIRQWQRSRSLTGDAVTGTFDPNTVALAAAAPIRITAVNAKLGQSQVSPASYTGVTLHAQATLTATQAATFKAGDEAQVVLPDNTTVETTLASVGQGGQKTGDTGQATHPSARIDFPDQSQVAAFGPTAVQVIIPNADASTGETLIVPVTALIASAGSPYAVEAVRGGKLVRVPVSIGLVSDAQVQIQVRRPQGGRQGGGLMNDIEFAPAGGGSRAATQNMAKPTTSSAPAGGAPAQRVGAVAEEPPLTTLSQLALTAPASGSQSHGALLTLEHVMKAFPGKDGSLLEILHDTSLAIDRGEPVAIVGPSGSGKSTLLSLLGTLDMPTSGIMRYDGGDVNAMGERQRSVLRAARIGFVFQQFHLIATVSALENAMTGLQYTTLPRGERRQRASEALEQVGLGNRLHHRPAQLSGGEQQRVAIARALAKRPDIIFADEPASRSPSTGPPCRSPGPPPSWSASSPASTRPPAPPVSPRPRPCAANRGDGWSERSP